MCGWWLRRSECMQLKFPLLAKAARSGASQSCATNSLKCAAYVRMIIDEVGIQGGSDDLEFSGGADDDFG